MLLRRAALRSHGIHVQIGAQRLLHQGPGPAQCQLSPHPRLLRPGGQRGRRVQRWRRQQQQQPEERGRPERGLRLHARLLPR